MKGFTLDAQALSELHDAHCRAKRAGEAKLAYRLNAVILLGTGWRLKQVSQALLLDDETLRSYVKRYRESGVVGIASDKHQGRMCRLSSDQTDLLKAHLDEHICLSTGDVIAFIEQHFSVSYSVSGVTNLLHRLGYVYKRPKVVPGKADADAQLQFLEDYDQIQAEMGPEDVLYFMDASHPTHNTRPSFGWIKRGERREIKSNSGRQRININGAINIQSMDVQYRVDKTINADSVIALYQQIEAANPNAQAIYLVQDNARVHHAKQVQEYLKTSRIKPLFLPAYSPNLNLIERLWKFFSKKVLYNQYYEKFEQFRQRTLNFFDNIKAETTALRRLLTEKFEIIGVPSKT